MKIVTVVANENITHEQMQREALESARRMDPTVESVNPAGVETVYGMRALAFTA